MQLSTVFVVCALAFPGALAHPLLRHRRFGSTISRRADFTLSNGQQAQTLNAKFATLAAGSACDDGDQACVGGQFAQCVGGKLQTSSSCSGGTSCFALPLVNKPGTSVTCDTRADAEARIAETGATGGLTGDGAPIASATADAASSTAVSDGAATSSPTNLPSSTAPAATSAPAASASASTDFRLANGQQALKLNAEFASLQPNSTCQEGQEACVGGQFAQCVGGSFRLTACPTGLRCAALPLVNKSGTSVTCDTDEDADERISQTGASAGRRRRS